MSTTAAAPLAVTMWPALAQTRAGERVETSWTQLGAWLSASAPRPTDVGNPALHGWSAAVFADGRRLKERVTVVTAVVLDIDKGGVSLDQIRDHFAGTAAFVHSTRRFQASAPRWRIVLGVSRPMTPDEHAIVWTRERDRLAARGVKIDESTKDASRFWYAPCEPAEGAFVFAALEGELLDVDQLVRGVAVVDGRGESPAGPEAADDSPPEADRIERARAYARKIAPAISGERGHATAFRAAVKIARGFDLPEEAAVRVLAEEWNPSCRPPWSEGELRRKVHEAATKGRMPLGALVRARVARSPLDGVRRAEPNGAPRADRTAESRAPSRAPSAQNGDDRDGSAMRSGMPEIVIATDLHRMVTQASEALGRHDGVFQRANQLVQVLSAPANETIVAPGAPTVRPIHPATLREMLTKVSSFVAYDGRTKEYEPALPPEHVVAALVQRGEWPTVRALVGILEAPSMRVDGSILQDPGYDASTGYLYTPSVAFGQVPDSPTRDDAIRAREELDEVFCDFPFVDATARAVPLAALLTVLARPAIRGSTPAFLTDANARGSGKTLVTDAISVLATGRLTAKMAYPHNDEELEKVLAAYAVRGSPLINFDNITRSFGGGPLDRCITAVDAVELRILGKSEISTLPWRAVLFGTGNNLQICGDTARRTLRSAGTAGTLSEPHTGGNKK